MASQAAFFGGSSPPPPIKKANTASSTTTETSSSKTKNGIKTITTKYITTTRTPTDLPDQNTNTINQEKKEYNDGTTDDITLTRKVLGGMQYDIETIIRVTTKDVGKKNTKTTYATPYQQLDPVTGKPINAFSPATHKGLEHAKTPDGLAAQIGARAPKVSGMAHNVVPTTTRGGVPTGSGSAPSVAAQPAQPSLPAASPNTAPVLSPAPNATAPGNGKNYLNSGTHTINTTKVSVDMTNTKVHKQAPKKTFVPAFAQQKLKSPSSPTRTFRGGTQVVTTKAMPNISKPNAAPTIITPNSPKRLAQPHEKVQVAPAPVAYVPDDRLYKKKADDQGWKQNTASKQTTPTKTTTVAAQPTPTKQNNLTKQPAPAPTQPTPKKQTQTTVAKQATSTKKSTVTKQTAAKPRPKSPPRASVEQREDDDEISC